MMTRKTEKIVTSICLLLILAMTGPWLVRIFITDSFNIKGVSMTPTYHTGQKVWANKLIIGPRIYTSFDFSSPDLKCFRLPGVRKLRVGDVAVFNYPWGWEEFSIGFKINYVYCKRCSGCPGDTVSVSDCHLFNSRVGDIPGYSWDGEDILRAEPDSALLAHKCLRAGQFAGKEDDWTIKDMGPVYVPGKGDRITLTPENAAMYALVIEYETGSRPQTERDGDYTEYVFRENYYFFTGDFSADSKDSRYIGFVPEKFVIGVVKTERK